MYLNFTDQSIIEALGLDGLQTKALNFAGNLVLNYTPLGWLFGIGTGIGSAIFLRK